MRKRRLTFLALLGAAALSVQPAGAETEHSESGHKDPGITIDERASLSGLLDAAARRHPDSRLFGARRATAASETGYGSRWFPESAELSGYYWNDRAYDDFGAYEAEIAVSLPLWMPGEKRARSEYGEALGAAQQSFEAEFRWRLGGLLRQRAWRVLNTRRHWELAEEQEARLEKVLEHVTLLTEAGDTSRSDLLAATQELALWRSDTLALEAEYRDAVREFAALTGGYELPASLEEPLSERLEIDDSHPAMQSALDRAAAASANSDAISEGNASRPSVNVFWREFRGDRSVPDNNALGIGFSMPLGKSPSHRPEIARANEAFAEAEADVHRTRRDLELQLHEAHHWLRTVERQLDNSRVLVDTATERHRLDELAFELGELSVRQWLRRLAEIREIETTYELMLLERGAAIAACNQAAGDVL